MAVREVEGRAGDRALRWVRRSAPRRLSRVGIGFIVLSGLAVPIAPANASGSQAEKTLLAMLNGAQPLADEVMARQTARGSGAGVLPEMQMPSSAPIVRLWDDVGAVSATAIGATRVTIGAGGSGQ